MICLSGEKPRERLRDNGPGSLSSGELIAILLRDGTRGENVLALSNRILSELDGLEGLSRTNLDEICQFRGIGPAKASQVIAALELGRRTSIMSPRRQSLSLPVPTTSRTWSARRWRPWTRSS